MVLAIRTISVLLLLCMMAQINCIAVYCGLFAVNRKAIAETACEKKTMDCCGHCFLQKKIESSGTVAQSPAEKNPSNKFLENLPKQMPALEPMAHLVPVPGNASIRREQSVFPALAEGVHLQIDHPPNPLLHMTAA